MKAAKWITASTRLALHQFAERAGVGDIHHAQARWLNVVAVALGKVVDHHRVEARAGSAA